MSMHTAQPVVADRRNQTEAAAARNRLARGIANADDGGATAVSRPAAAWPRISLGGFRRPFRRVRSRAVA
jgi:hypothetical protein